MQREEVEEFETLFAGGGGGGKDGEECWVGYWGGGWHLLC